MLSRLVLHRAYRKMGERSAVPFTVRFADGSEYRNKSEQTPVFTISYKYPHAERATLLLGAAGLAEHYFKQNVDIEGDLVMLATFNTDGGGGTNPVTRVLNWWHELMHSNRSLRHAKENARYHYNRGTELFRQYLDPTMTYTCAYWKEGTTTLEQAQRDKLEHVCKKLRLQPGDTLVDIGSGWGSLLFRAYENYGVLGTNVSPTPDQNAAMQKEIERRGLQGKIQIQEADFREAKGVYDKYVSLGVYEHAGYNQLEDWIRGMAGSLKEGGTGVLHFIGNINRDLEETGYFIRRYIFPGGYLPGLGETVEIMDRHGLEILDIENLRRHYAPTLRAWAENFDKNWEKIRALEPEKYDEYFRRMWRFYLYGCSGIFLAQGNSAGLFQIVFSKGKTTAYPMTRDFLYK